MIENVVFDFGQVLIKFDPDHMVGRYVTDAVDAALLSAVVFDRLYWDKLDAGTLGDAEAERIMQSIAESDTPSPLEFQFDCLRQLGFREVALLHKNLVFAAYYALK